jgi:hypothetical protein
MASNAGDNFSPMARSHGAPVRLPGASPATTHAAESASRSRTQASLGNSKIEQRECLYLIRYLFVSLAPS